MMLNIFLKPGNARLLLSKKSYPKNIFAKSIVDTEIITESHIFNIYLKLLNNWGTRLVKEVPVRSTVLIQLIMENRIRDVRGPVKFHIESVTCMLLLSKFLNQVSVM